MENTLFYIFLFLIYPVIMFGTVLLCTRKQDEQKEESEKLTLSDIDSRGMDVETYEELAEEIES